jgi:hypothetical protein
MIDAERTARPGAHALARVVSLAARIEPALLRRARLALLPHVDAGAEADLWFSPLVQSRSPLAIIFAPDVADLLRRSLAQDQDLLGRAWEVVKRVHIKSSPVIRLEEEIIYLALSDQPTARGAIRDLLLSATRTMIEGDGRGLAQWALRALPRLPEEARSTEAAWALAIGAGARLGGRRILADEASAPISQTMLRWVLPRDQEQVSVGVRLFRARVLGTGVEVSEPPAEGAHVIRLPKTDPMLLNVSSEEDFWNEGHYSLQTVVSQVALHPGQTQTVETEAPDEVQISTPTGDTFTLRQQYDVYVIAENPADKPWVERLVMRLREEQLEGRPLVVTLDMESAPLEPESAANQILIVIERKMERIRRASRKVVQIDSFRKLEGDDKPLIFITHRAAEIPESLGDNRHIDFRDDNLFMENFRELLAAIRDEPFTAPAEPLEPIELYCAYAHSDKELMNRLRQYLAPSMRTGVIGQWHDREIGIGDMSRGEIDEHLDSSDLILLLVSADFLDSEFAHEVEMKRALERHEAQKARVIPIILRPCHLENTPLAHLQTLPTDGRPLTQWSDPEEAWQQIAQRIRIVAEEISREKRAKETDETGHKPLVYLSYSGRDSHTTELLQTLTDALREDYEVYLDRERLQPGGSWAQESNTQMMRADAALMLLSDDALNSLWVRREAAILSYRRHMDESFLLLTILLGGIVVTELVERLGVIRWQDIQSLRAIGPPTDTVARIMKALEPLKQRGPHHLSYDEQLVKLISDRLRVVSNDVLLKLSEVEESEGFSLAEVIPAQDLLARRIVQGGLDELSKVLQALKDYINESDIRRIIELVIPTWVNPDAARAVRRVALRPQGTRAMCVNATEQFTATSYVSRASERWPPWQTIPFNIIGSEDRPLEMVLAELERTIKESLRVSADEPDEILSRRFEMDEEPIFIVFPPPLPPTSFIERVMETYPFLTLMLLSGRELPRPEELPHDKVELIYPELRPGEEEKAQRTILSLRSMLRHS